MRLKDVIGNEVGFYVVFFDDFYFFCLEEVLYVSFIVFLFLIKDFCENDWFLLCNNIMFV